MPRSGRTWKQHVGTVDSGIDPTVAGIILGGRAATAADWAADTARLLDLGRARPATAGRLRRAADPDHHLASDPGGKLAADPVGANARMGRYTNFANLLDMASLAVPAGFVDGRPFGVMFTGPAFSDRALASLAQRFANPAVDVFVVGAHLTGQPLNAQLVAAGGSLVGAATTAPIYRLHALDTSPPKPGSGPRPAR